MAGISSPGIGSGLDVQTIVSQLVALERRPIDQVNRQKATTEATLSSFGLLQSYTTNMRDAARALAKPDLWTKATATSSQEAAVAVSASASATEGSYSVEVSQLARAQGLASGAFASSASTVGSGNLTIALGTWTETVDPGPPETTSHAFTGNGATAIDVPIDAGDTLLQIRNKINDADAGVTASIVNDGSGARLVLRSTETGAENAARITVDDPSLEALAYDPENGVGTMTQTLKALDAQATINGLSVTNASNTLTDVVEGLTLTLKTTNTSAAQVTVGKDTAAMRSAVDEFVKSYNAINTYLRDQTKYDATTKVAGKLQGDSAARSLQNQMRSLTQMTSGASAGYATLSSLGITVQRDGSLLLDSSRFNEALANPSAVATAFTNDDVGEANDGFAVRINALTTALTGTDGLIESRTEGLRAAIRRQEDRITQLEDRVSRTEERLLRQYSALDTRLGSLTGLGNYVSQQVTAWNNAKG